MGKTAQESVIRGKCRIEAALETLHLLFFPLFYSFHLLNAASIYAPPLFGCGEKKNK